ncbi:MAG: DUF3891 family protein [Solirubrobacterales bacterium]
MLVTRRAERFTLVAQYDHGALAGVLAERWGNERFAPVAARLREALVLAASHHDDGWRELDDLPAHNAEAGRPAHFLELPIERTAPPYGRGVDSVYERDPLAGALVAMHWTGLYSGRWGLQSAGGPRRSEIAREVVEREERRRAETLREIWGFEGRRGCFEADVWHAYEVLQALDIASLALSLLDPEAPSGDAEPVSVMAALAAVEQPPGPRLLPAVPTAPQGELATLTLTVVGPGLAVLDPWPFAGRFLDAELPARSLPAVPMSEEKAAAAFRAAAPETIRWRLRSSV